MTSPEIASSHETAEVESMRRTRFTPQFPVLDTLRAIGAFAVLLTHVSFWSGDYWRHGVVGTMLARLNVGVAIFFVLSGFLLSHHYLSRAAHGTRPERVRRYFWKRLLRIYPVYVVAVVAAMLFVRNNAGAGPKDWFMALSMVDIYFHDTLRHGQTQMWSLATEVAFYSVLPLLMYLATGRHPQRPSTNRVMRTVIAMVVANLVWTLWASDRLTEHGVGLAAEWLPSYLMWFAAGIALAWAHILHSNGRGGEIVARIVMLGQSPGVSWTLALSLFVVSATSLAGPATFGIPTPAEALTRRILFGLVGVLIVLTGVFARSGSSYERSMASPVLRRLGLISYSVFCLHLVVLHFVYWITPYTMFEGHDFWPVLAMTLVLTLVVSELSYRLVEMPAMRLRNLGRTSSE